MTIIGGLEHIHDFRGFVRISRQVFHIFLEIFFDSNILSTCLFFSSIMVDPLTLEKRLKFPILAILLNDYWHFSCCLFGHKPLA